MVGVVGVVVVVGVVGVVWLAGVVATAPSGASRAAPTLVLPDPTGLFARSLTGTPLVPHGAGLVKCSEGQKSNTQNRFYFVKGLDELR